MRWLISPREAVAAVRNTVRRYESDGLSYHAATEQAAVDYGVDAYKVRALVRPRDVSR
jgi:hypothetical protein